MMHEMIKKRQLDLEQLFDQMDDEGFFKSLIVTNKGIVLKHKNSYDEVLDLEDYYNQKIVSYKEDVILVESLES